MPNILDALVIAKGLSALGAANSLANYMVPRKMLSVYHRSGPPANRRKVQIHLATATSLLSLSVVAISTIFFGMHINKAAAICQVPWVLNALRSLFVDQNWKHLGDPLTTLTNDLLPLIAGILFACASWNESDASSRIFGAFMLVNGCSVMTNMESHAKLWRDVRQQDAQTKSSLRTLGFAMNGLGTIILSMAYFGASPAQAFGYSWIWMSLMSIWPLLSDESKRLNLNKPALMAFIPINMFALLILICGN
jgi:hypothetical protein